MQDYGKREREVFLHATKPTHLGDKLEKLLFIAVIVYFGGHLAYHLYTH